MPTRERVDAAIAKVMEALGERARRAWRARSKLEDIPIGRDLAKAFDEWEMLDGIMRNADPEPEPEQAEEPELPEPEPESAEPRPKWTGWTGSAGLPPSTPTPPKTLREAQQQAIEDALAFADGRVSAAAILLDMPLATLYEKIHALGIDVTRFRK
jgi:DNA-binding NtrC family response regulator